MIKISLPNLRTVFGGRLQENVVLANYTTARAGGSAAGLIVANTADELADTARTLWEMETPFMIIGSGSNILVSDTGYAGVVILNRARNIKIDTHHASPTVWAESGANLGGIARQAALRGLSGLEWAATIPGTVGGAVYGNAGAHGGDMKGSLLLAEILHPDFSREEWQVDRLDYTYRSSVLKRQPNGGIILAARMKLNQKTSEDVKALMEKYTEQRRRTQPPGASMGSMFKNPPGDYAGRLIEAAGLKGTRVGGVEISQVHANFFVNNSSATASDIYNLIQIARQQVHEKFGVQLELEIELLGNWEEKAVPSSHRSSHHT
jgi:UDP-N-acetylmuramate dehydrogenase